MTGFQIGVCIFLALSACYQTIQIVVNENPSMRFGYIVSVAIYVTIIIGLISKW